MRYEGGWDRKNRMGERGWYKENGKKKRGREEGRGEKRVRIADLCLSIQ